jgi:predicted Zn-dependent protease
VPIVCLFIFVFSMLAGCGPAPHQGPGHRPQRLAMTPQQELSLGQQAYQEVLSQATVVPDGPERERVRRVGERIARAAAIEPLEREINLQVHGYRFEWEFNVIRDDKTINAFCLPGGKVAVFTGLLPVTENDDQLATVMGHEIAHALAHHASERLARTQLLQTAIKIADGVLGIGDVPHGRDFIGVLAAGASFSGLKYERQQESEADHIGLFLMTFAGYRPEETVVFWRRMQQAGAGQARPPEILSDHPSDARRIAQLQAWVPQAGRAKHAYDQGRIAPAR